MVNQELRNAEAHLERAEADLKAAHDAEGAAEGQIEVAIHEIQEAEEHHRHEIHFDVDGEPCETTKHELTPNQIIEEFGKKNPADHYLVQIVAGHTESYQGKGDLPIKMHNCMNFQIVSTGPKPVSNGPMATGVEVFLDGLRAMGYDPKLLQGKSDHVLFDYRVPSGRFTGRSVRLGFVVPTDFPMTTPTGPHVSPRIHPSHPAGDVGHPLGGVHDSQSAAFQQDAGGDWQYWSRPYPGWATARKNAIAYMSHIYRLWETQ
ncbi:MAG: hypothetical protein ABSE79_11270 [Terriglobia bacterium]|jgi:hypothetical protein